MFCRCSVSEVVLPLVLLHLLAGCGGWRTSETIQNEIMERNGRAKVRATLWDSRAFVLRNASIRNGRLRGRQKTEITRSSEREGVIYASGGDMEIPLSEIETLEIYEDSGGGTALLVGGMVVFTVGVILAISALNDSYDSAFFEP